MILWSCVTCHYLSIDTENTNSQNNASQKQCRPQSWTSCLSDVEASYLQKSSQISLQYVVIICKNAHLRCLLIRLYSGSHACFYIYVCTLSNSIDLLVSLYHT